jgi:DNA-binding transcriptional ArsR family regulator
MGAELPWLPPVWLARAVDRLREVVSRVHRRTALPPVALLELTMGAWLSQALWAAARLNIADALAQGPRTPTELARELGVDEPALTRLLRALSAHGVFAQRRDGRYAQSALSHHLRREVPGSLRDYLLFLGHPRHRDHWSTLDLTVRSGHSEFAAGDGFFGHLSRDRELGAVFDAGMTALSRLGGAATLASYDFSRFDVIVDIGGGRGAHLATILQEAPRTRGVVFDLPEVTAGVEPAQLALGERLRVESGSFFERVPTGGDAYILKHILHDWNDERAQAILQNVRRAMPAHGTLLIIESVVPAGPGAHLAKLIDLEMLVIDGKERTEREWRDLLARSGFTLARILPTAGPVSILEAMPTDGTWDA